MSSSARSSRSAPTSRTSTPATSSAARATSCAAAAATAWPAVATCAPTRSASASAATARSRSTWPCPMTNIWHHWPGVDEEVAAIFDPFGNAVHTALAFPILGEDVLDQRGRTDRAHGDGRRPPRRAPGTSSSASPTPTDASWPSGWAPRSPSTRANATCATSFAGARHGGGLRRRAGDVGQRRRRSAAAIAAMAHGGGDRASSGIPTEEIVARRQRDRLQDADPARHLRSRDVRDLVQDDGHAPVGAGHQGRPSPTGSGSATSRRRSRRRATGIRARSSWTGRHERPRRDPGRSPATRPDPLAFLDDEVAALRERHLYRPLRVMSSAQGPIVSVDERRLISLSSNDYLGLTHHPRLREAALEAVREFGVGQRRGPDDRRHDGDARGARGRARGLQGHARRPDVPVRVHGQHRRHPDDHRRDRPDRLRRAQPRLDHRRDAPVEGAAQGLSRTPTSRRCARSSARPASRAGRRRGEPPSADPRRHRRRVLDGRRHRATPRDRRGGRGVRGGRHGRRRPRVGRPRAERPRHGRPLRPPRPRRDPGRDAVARPSARSAATWRARMALREILTQRARPFLFSTSHPPAVVAACREAIRVMEEEPELQERLWANTRRFKAELTRLGFDTGRSETPITPVMMGDPDTAGRFSDRLIDEGVFAQPVVFPTVAIDKSRLRTIVTAAHADEQLDQALAAFDRSATSWVSSRGDRPPGARPAARRPPPYGPVARQRRPDRRLRRARPSSAGSPSSPSPTTSTSSPGRRPTRTRRSTSASARSARPPNAGRRRASPSGSASSSRTTATWEADIRDHLRRHAYDFTIGSVHDRRRLAVHGRRASPAGSPGGRSPRSSRRTSTRSEAAARSGLFDALGHIDFVKRYLAPARDRRRTWRTAPELYEPILRALVDSGHGPRDQHQRPAPAAGRDLPVAGHRRAVPRARRASGHRRLRRPPRRALRVRARRTATATPRPRGSSRCGSVAARSASWSRSARPCRAPTLPDRSATLGFAT